ncbi:MAG: proline dehydrogenase family protein, partial [Betaproteobacteria bacterium]|nr:proline dehydrogenase family protein [Betaproteobacteria bacterium]
ALAAGMAGHARATLALRLLAAFPLTGAEGQALMRMTEALLRIPDRATAVQLLADELGAAAWQPRTRDPAARAAAWALRAGSALLRGPGGRARAGLGAPALAVARRFVHHFGGQFVFADAIEHAVSRLRPGASYSFDMLGEQALNAADVQRFHAAYLHAIRTLGPLRQQGRDVGISIKLSALHPRYGAWQRERVLHELVPRVKQLVDAARGFDLPVCIDAEEAARLELSIDVFDALSAAVRGWGGLGLAVQAYQTRALAVLREVERLAQRDARRIPVRLVKGAYWDSEIKRAQAEGLPGYPVYTRKEHTDLSYLACAAQMLGSPHIRAAFATHNAYSFAAVRALAQAAGRERDFEYQCLHGMGEPLYDAARAQGRLGVPVRIYAPVGAFDALLPYLVRRLLENGANTSFLHQLATADAAAGNTALLALHKATPAIAAPAALFGARRNAQGVDLQRADVASAFCATPLPQVHAVPVYTPTSAQNALGSKPMLQPVPVLNPTTGAAVGSVRWADAGDVSLALAAARNAAPGWAATPPARRAQCLRAWGDALEQGMAHFSALAVAEAGKTWPNAVADVREAIDFCRYYAELAQGTACGEPLGVVATIAPWNFPLAIFTGQVAAALAAGNVVMAKPAEQTPLMAFEAVRAAHAAGVPAEVLHLLPGGGDVGAALVQDARVDGVMFTGSLQVAKLIERNL